MQSEAPGARAARGLISHDAPLEHVTPYDRFAWSDLQIERWLASGEHRAELSAYFGTQEYRKLAALARRAARVGTQDAPLRVCIVPGIMGSQLGLRRAAPLPHDILWIDPIDIQLGRLAALRFPGGAPVVPLGVVLFSYLRLKLYLRARGYRAEFYDYDWRQPLQVLGPAFAAHLRALAPQPVAIVAHSLGGLVSRAALHGGAHEHVQRVILLGTPNCGSFAAVQALRGTYAVVRKVASLAATASAESLTTDVFSSFPSLYDLLPSGKCAGNVDLFDAGSWPTAGPQPRDALLRQARAGLELLAPADGRFASIAGVGQETVTAVRRRQAEFLYTVTRHGDGTVPSESAVLPGSSNYYAHVAHSDLMRDAQVAAAVVELLKRGNTSKLPGLWRTRSYARAKVSDRQLRRGHAQKVDWTSLTPQERRVFLQNLNEPQHLRLRIAPKRRKKKE